MDTQLLKKYRSYPQVSLPQRQRPDNRIESPLIWCSVDWRGRNQALVQPMSIEKKFEMYRLILQMGFKEIEVGFPSAAQVEFDFTRRSIENDLIADGVLIPG